MPPHDNSYKQFFSHPEMVKDLLIGFIHQEWIKQLDFNTLETVKSSFVTDDLREREDDIIWRVRWGQEWVYVYLLIEFQSRVDKFMAVRIMNYVSLLYQDLIKQDQLTANQRLPPVFPIVLYNGERRWKAAQNVKELIEPIGGGLEHYCPSVSYLLLDQGAIIAESEIAEELRNLAGALFRLEHSRTEQDVIEVITRLGQWLNTPAQASVRRAFTVWIVRVLLPDRFPDVEFPVVQDLYEVQTMLAERVKEWRKRWEEEGLQQGLEQGLQQGIERGLKQGMERGLQQGIERGLQQGMERGLQQAKLEVARNLVHYSTMDNVAIAKVTGLDEETIKQLRTVH